MAQTIKRPFRSFNGTDWDKHYFETSADQVKMNDGTNVEAKVTQHLADNTAHQIGDKAALKTTAKNSIVAAINELFTNASNGKNKIATAITGKGVSASGSDAFSVLAGKIGQIEVGDYKVGDVVQSQKYVQTHLQKTLSAESFGNYDRSFMSDRDFSLWTIENLGTSGKVNRTTLYSQEERIYEHPSEMLYSLIQRESDGTVFCGSSLGSVIALSIYPSTMEYVATWDYKVFSDSTVFSMLIDRTNDSILYLGADNPSNTVCKVQLFNPSKVWSIPEQGRIQQLVQGKSTKIYATIQYAKFFSIYTQDGVRSTSISFPYEVTCLAVGEDETIYLSTKNKDLYAYNGNSRKWRKPLPYNIASMVIGKNGVLYFFNRRNSIKFICNEFIGRRTYIIIFIKINYKRSSNKQIRHD
jgi:hypothetical protein